MSPPAAYHVLRIVVVGGAYAQLVGIVREPRVEGLRRFSGYGCVHLQRRVLHNAFA
jgi:hypothetical protein